MADDRTTAYARAMFDVARAEGNPGRVTDQLRAFTQALGGSDELRERLADPHLPASLRQQIVEDLLGGRAEPATVSLVSMAVAGGRARELPAIVDAISQLNAESAGKTLAEVRSAIALSDDQQQRLAAALEKATGRPVDVRVVVDPSILGGVVTTVGDTVIDGSVRTRLEQLKHAF